MHQDTPILDYASPPHVPEPVSPRTAFLTFQPGLFAILIYIAQQFRNVPTIFAYLFWPLLVVGVIIGAACFVRFRRSYRGRGRPWFVSISLAIHIIVMLVGAPFILLLIAGALTGNLL